VLKNAIQLTSNSKFFGFGVGDVQKELNKQYFDNKFNLLAKVEYNAHNQYIQIVLTVGYIGLFIFLVALIYCTYNLHLKKDYFGVTILIFFSIFFNTESYLERQNGIIFFSLIL
jgi:O-antigen ligase